MLTAAEREVAVRFGVTVPRGFFGSVATIVSSIHHALFPKRPGV
jgi:hypothetical protein